MTANTLLSALERLSYGVTVVTVGRGGAENGLTVSWVCQVSHTPPLVMIAVDENHFSVEFLDSTKSFVVNVLAADQGALAGRFARPSYSDESKLDGITCSEAPSGAAILDEALAYLDCEVVQRFTCGDHVLFVGEVRDGKVLREAEPLTSNAGMRYRKRPPTAR